MYKDNVFNFALLALMINVFKIESVIELIDILTQF